MKTIHISLVVCLFINVVTNLGWAEVKKKIIFKDRDGNITLGYAGCAADGFDRDACKTAIHEVEAIYPIKTAPRQVLTQYESAYHNMAYTSKDKASKDFWEKKEKVVKERLSK